MSEVKKKDAWVPLGNLIRNTTTRDGKAIPVNEQKTYLKLSDEVFSVLQKAGLNVSQNGVLTTPVEEVESLFKRGQIKEDEIEARREKAKEIQNSWLRYKIQLPPPRSGN